MVTKVQKRLAVRARIHLKKNRYAKEFTRVCLNPYKLRKKEYSEVKNEGHPAVEAMQSLCKAEHVIVTPEERAIWTYILNQRGK
jgi:hypothetical protein